ncbi:MAG TPA: hypothetical protein VLJ19_07430, partial [Variovorax sp.]|nr:hypothetical protein [Variovorax sp.]
MRISTPLAATALCVQRAPLSRIAGAADGSRPPLGALGYGACAALSWMSTVNAPVLGENSAMADLWLAGEHIQSGRSGAVRWRSDGHWMLGSIDLEEGGAQQGLEQLSRAAYRDLFAA